MIGLWCLDKAQQFVECSNQWSLPIQEKVMLPSPEVRLARGEEPPTLTDMGRKAAALSKGPSQAWEQPCVVHTSRSASPSPFGSPQSGRALSHEPSLCFSLMLGGPPRK